MCTLTPVLEYKCLLGGGGGKVSAVIDSVNQSIIHVDDQAYYSCTSIANKIME